jgi:hypothetical protein
MEESKVSQSADPRQSSHRRDIALTIIITLLAAAVFQKLITAPSGSAEQRAKRSEALLMAGEQLDKKYDAYIPWLEEDEKRNDALFKQREEFNARFEKILATWERQQREYQAYLDSLKTKSH